jgi:hypothetical protein
MPPHPTFFLPKKIYDEYGLFDTSYKYCADYDLLLRLKDANVSFYLIEKILANFRFGTGVSSSFAAYRESFNMRYKHGRISKLEKIIKTIGIYFVLKIKLLYQDNKK